MSATIAALLEATWPPEETAALGSWRARYAAGAGRRVCSARATTSDPDALIAGLDAVEAFYAARAAAPTLHLFTEEAAALDRPLADRGYRPEAETRILTADAATVGARPQATDAQPYLIRIAAPLAGLDALWAAGGVGPARRAVMARATASEVIAVRIGQRLKGAAFVAAGADGAMIHALHIAEDARRRGAAADLIAAAARWTAARGIDALSAAVEAANAPAARLFEKLGFAEVARYRYAVKPTD